MVERQHERLGSGNRFEVDMSLLYMADFGRSAIADSKCKAKKSECHGFDPGT